MSRLRILFVADEAAGLSLRHLLDARDQPASRCISDDSTLAQALADAEWDAVVVQSLAPRSIEAVLDALRDRQLAIPVIAAVRGIGEEAAADLMRAGVRDVVAMDNGPRLRAALERETRRTASQVDLADARQLLENIASHVPGDIYRRVLHTDGRVTYPFTSEGFIRRLGYGVADIEADAGLFAEMVHDEDREAYRTAYANSAQSLTPFDHRWRVRAKSGDYRWVHGIAGVRRLDNGDVVWDGITIDVTREMESENRLRNLAANIPGVIYQRINHADGRVSYPFVSSGVRDLFGYEPREIMDRPEIFSDTVLGESAGEYKRLVEESARKLTPYRWFGMEHTRDGREIWTQVIGRPTRLENGDIRWDSVLLDMSEQRKIESALRESERRLKSIANNIPGAVFRRVLHADGRMSYPYSSGYMEREFGIGAIDTLGKPRAFLDAVHPDDRPIWEEAVAVSARQMAPFDLTYRMRTPQGEIRWIQTLAGVRTLENGEVTWDGIALDVTRYQKTEQELRERTAQLESLASNIPGVIYQRIQHTDGHVTFPYISKGVKDIYGYTAEELMANPAPFRSAAMPEDQEWHDKGAELSAESMQPWVWEGRIRRKDGQIRWVHVHARPHRLPEGAVAWDGFVLDVTSRTLAEQAARETASQIESLAANLPGVVFRRIQHPDGRREYPFISPRVRELFGYSAQELMADPTPFQAVATEAEQREHDALGARSARTLEPWQMECRIRHRDGTLKWIHFWAQPHKREDGAVIWDGVTLDVTDHKLAEVELDALARQQSAVVALGQNALGGTLTNLFEAAVEAVAVTLSADLASLLELDTHHQTLRLIAARGWPEGAVGKNVFPNNESVPAGYALKTRRPVIVSNAATDVRFKLPPSLKAQGVVSGLSIAIGPPERPFGAISAYTRHQRDFSVQDADFLRAVANVIAAAVERERTEKDRRRLSSVVEQSPNAIVIADADGLVEYANQAHATMTGFSRDEFVGAHVLRWADRKARDGQSRAIREAVLSGKTWRGERQERRKTGEAFWCREMIMGVRDGSGHIAGVASIFEDVTERKQVEAQLAQVSKLSTLGEMASGLTHELNQPLNIIRMAADSCLILMEEDNFDATHEFQQLEIISSQTERMAEIINHMRIFSRKDRVEVEPFDPSNSARAAVRLVSEQLRLSEIGLSTSVPAACRPVLGHPLRLEQVVINLLNNAKDAVLEQRGRSAGQGKIELELVDDRKTNTIDIRVTDTGGGIAPDVLEHIFEPFYTTKDPGKGTGLGLSIVYAIVTSMGGSITAANTGKGVRFTVSLPVDPGFGSKRARRGAKRNGKA
ncbi:MAG: PAS domain-containing protein [Alphaproteobacteria bacterium]